VLLASGLAVEAVAVALTSRSSWSSRHAGRAAARPGRMHVDPPRARLDRVDALGLVVVVEGIGVRATLLEGVDARVAASLNARSCCAIGAR
jgi:hypothetical protein